MDDSPQPVKQQVHRKKEIALEIAQRTGLPYVQCTLLINSLIKHIKDALSQQQPVKISNFGVFTPRDKAQRIGRNPKTGKLYPIPAMRTVLFRPANGFKKKLHP